MSSSSPTPEQWAAMSKLVQQFYSKPDAEPFREEVDWKSLGLFDYPTMIKKPMDLGTIKKKLDARQYSTLWEVIEDVRLVWSNCMTYNADGSDFFLLAQNLQKKWQDKLAKTLGELGISESPPSAASNESMVSLEDKRAFAKSLYKLSKDELGSIIVELDEKCPAALTKNSAEDEVQINVDKIAAPLFSELVTFANTSISKKKKASNKKQKTTN